MITEVVNKNKDRYDVYIGRGSKWGNPYTHLPLSDTQAKYKVSSRKESIEKYKEYLLIGDGSHLLNDLDELKGKKLGCYCKPKSCHGDILSTLCNNLYYESILFD